MTSLLIKTVFLAFVVAQCASQVTVPTTTYEEIISEGKPIILPNGYLEMSDVQPISGCLAVRLSPSERQGMVNLHNDLRRRIARGKELRGDNGPQPPAKNMREMHYDPRLENIALARVSMCSSELPVDTSIEGYTSIFRSMIVERDRMSQFNITDYVMQRYELVKFMPGHQAVNETFSGKNLQTDIDLRSYAILVNAKTYGIGCAHSYFFHKRTGQRDRYLVCNYASGLNYTQPLYDEGEPCDEMREDCCDRGLLRGYCW